MPIINRAMGKKHIAAAVFFILVFSVAVPSHAYVVTFKEQFFRLFHMHLERDPDNYIENIYWLEQALKAEFANPLHAITPVQDETQWEKYRCLFMMHLNVKMAEQHMFLGSMWSRRRVFFFNAPWKEQNLESFETAEATFRAAMYYWEEAKKWAAMAQVPRFRFVDLPGVQFWADSAARIETGDLDYGRTINRELANLDRMREEFRTMPDITPWEPPPAPTFPWD
jgi:hypothetical protein